MITSDEQYYSKYGCIFQFYNIIYVEDL